jgi:DNA-binding MarR family transcriptional regulator
MVAETSRQAYDEHRESGELGAQQRRLMLWFHEHQGEHTRSELARATGIRLSSICGRVNELIELGYLEEGAARKCRETNRTANPVRIRRPREPQQMSFLEERA